MTNVNPLFDPNTDNQSSQEQLVNTPLAGGQLDDEDQLLLSKIKELVDSGTLNLYAPSSLLNDPVYQQLPSDLKARADQKAMAMIAKIRQILDFHKLEMDTNYQEQNLLHSLRLDKEHMENEIGDVFVI